MSVKKIIGLFYTAYMTMFAKRFNAKSQAPNIPVPLSASEQAMLHKEIVIHEKQPSVFTIEVLKNMPLMQNKIINGCDVRRVPGGWVLSDRVFVPETQGPIGILENK